MTIRPCWASPIRDKIIDLYPGYLWVGALPCHGKIRAFCPACGRPQQG